MTSRAAPKALLLVSPNGATECEGSYSLVSGRPVNGYPLWKQSSGDYWLYSGLEGFWLIGGSGEAQLNFECDEGFIASTEYHRGVFPDEITSAWQYDDGKEWQRDPAIKIISRLNSDDQNNLVGAGTGEAPTSGSLRGDIPEVLIVNSPNGERECSGEYRLVHGKEVNGFLHWKNQNGERWLFSGLNGVWLFGGVEDARDLKFQCDYGLIASAEPHDGLTPDKITSGWQREDGNVPVVDRAITVFARKQNPWTALAPQELLVESPPAGGARCDGTYEIVTNTLANQMPLWKKEDDDRWLYSSLDGLWVIGGLEQKKLNFHCNEGYVASVRKHLGDMPDKVNSDWLRDDGVDWVTDKSIRITSLGDVRIGPGWTASTDALSSSPNELGAKVLYVSSPNGQQQCAGRYDLVLGARPNGFPHWKQSTGEHWIYSGLDGVWLFGGADEHAQKFHCDEGLIASTECHEGVMPEEYRKGWQRDNGTDWFVDPAIIVSNQLGELIPKDLVATLPPVLQDLAGPYQLVQNELCNGFPYWKHLGATRCWIYSSSAGCWLIGRAAERDCQVVGNERHGGRMPDHSPGGWLRCISEGKSFRWNLDEEVLVYQPGVSPSSLPKPSARLPGSRLPPPPALMATSVPSELNVTSALLPLEVEGQYFLYPGLVNGCPYWASEDGNFYLFSGTNAKWIFGGGAEKAKRFDTGIGIMVSSDRHNGVMPDNYQLPWKLSKDDGWVTIRDVEIVGPSQTHHKIRDVPTTLYVQEAHKAGLQSGPPAFIGRYEIVPGNWVSGLPVWKHVDNHFYLFSGTQGHWLIGGLKDKQANFASSHGLVESVAEHGGKMPDVIEGGWTPIVFVTRPQSGVKGQGGKRAPEHLVLRTHSKPECGGCYELARDEQANGNPLWQQRGGEYWLFSGLQGDWLFDGSDARNVDFRRTEGCIASADLHDGAMPNEITSGWQVLNDGQRETDTEAKVSVDNMANAPNTLVVMSPNGTKECAGRYELFPGKWANGYPVWKHVGAPHWMFSSKSGKSWLIGGARAEARNFHVNAGQISSCGAHLGVYPDQVSEGWQRDDGTEIIKDVGIRVATEGQVPNSTHGAEAFPRPEDQQIRDNTGDLVTTPLHVAAGSGQIGACKALLTNPQFKDVNVTNFEGRTALHLAALSGSAEVCQAILECKRFVAMDVQDFGGWTALHCAVWKNRSQACELLFEHHRFRVLEAVDVLGRTALDLDYSSASPDFTLKKRRRPPKTRRRELRTKRRQAALQGVGYGWDSVLMEEHSSSDEDFGLASGEVDEAASDSEYWNRLPFDQDGPKGSERKAPRPKAASKSKNDVVGLPGLSVKVIIRSAKGLQKPAKVDNLPDPFCIYGVPGQPRTAQSTAVVAGSLAPVWNHEGELQGFNLDDDFQVIVRNKDNKGAVLGQFILTTQQVLDNFDGDIPLMDAGGQPARGTLSIAVSVSTTDVEAAWRQRISLGYVPDLLVVKAAKADTQFLVSGGYVVVVSKFPNNYPMWKQRGGAHVLFSNPEGFWAFGDADEKKVKLNDQVGILKTESSHNGLLPQKYTALDNTWSLYDAETNEWQTEPSVTIFAKSRDQGENEDAGQFLVQKLNAMERRMGVLEEVTRAFWSAAPSDEDISAATKSKVSPSEVHAMERWRDAKQAALQSMQDYQIGYLEDVEEADAQSRLQELLDKAARTNKY